VQFAAKQAFFQFAQLNIPMRPNRFKREFSVNFLKTSIPRLRMVRYSDPIYIGLMRNFHGSRSIWGDKHKMN
jgi:hypothetical protein